MENNIVFAGEHTISNEYGYAHGAYNSGLTSANKIIKAIGKI
jgi:monoamine oxidase